jgi:glucose/arabinose dehydrogenase
MLSSEIILFLTPPLVNNVDTRYGRQRLGKAWAFCGPIGKGITAEKEMEQPLWVWTPGIAPSDMIFYTGSRSPQWRDNILVGAMAGHSLIRLVIQEGRVPGAGECAV